LLKHRAVSSWFGSEEVADVAFVSGMTYDPSKSGEEIIPTYGFQGCRDFSRDRFGTL
jgi:hypothetical protein